VHRYADKHDIGGEKKRGNIGSKPVTDPAILLLDEPTSGLDSTSAVVLMRILHDLVRNEGKTIITSIHHRSLAVFFAFNALMLLTDGKVEYLGTPNGSLEYVRDMGLECPGEYNAADHHMDLLVVDGAIDDDNDDDNNVEDDDNDDDDKDDDNDDGCVDGDDREGENDQTGGGWRTTAAAPLRRRRTGGGTSTMRLLIESCDAEASAKRIEDEDAAEQAMRFDGSGSAADGASAPGDGGGTFVARVRTGEHHCHPLCAV
jgi:ABC-type multidrug transport system ATPase subunit